MNLQDKLPPAWRPLLQKALQKESFKALEKFLEEEYASKEVFPPEEHLFSVLSLAILCLF